MRVLWQEAAPPALLRWADLIRENVVWLRATRHGALSAGIVTGRLSSVAHCCCMCCVEVAVVSVGMTGCWLFVFMCALSYAKGRRPHYSAVFCWGRVSGRPQQGECGMACASWRTLALDLR
jgi:hypothetical protein